jgi:hypothetical protein
MLTLKKGPRAGQGGALVGPADERLTRSSQPPSGMESSFSLLSQGEFCPWGCQSEATWRQRVGNTAHKTFDLSLQPFPSP